MTCFICNNETKTAHIQVPSFIDGKTFYNYEYCSNCKCFQLIFTEDLTQVQDSYNDSYEGFGEKGFFGKIKTFFTNIKVSKFKEYIEQKDILEIGSGTGQFLNACKNADPKSVTGLEISSYGVKYAQENYQINCIQGSIEQFQTDKKYDSIFMFHVIEHFKNPEEVLLKIKSLLKDDGVLIMETPSNDSWERFVLKNNWYGWQAPFHTFLFSPLSLKKLVAKIGFKNSEVIHSPVPNSWAKSLKVKTKIIRKILFPICFVISVPVGIAAKMCKKSGRITIIAKI